MSKNLNIFMNEIAQELGINNYSEMDKSMIPAVLNGYVGGNTTRLMNELAQKVIENSTEEQILSMMQEYDLHPPDVDIEKSKSLVSKLNL